MNIKTERLTEFYEKLKVYNTFVLTLHPGADPDSILSNFIMKEILEKLGKTVTVLAGDNKSLKNFDYLTKFTKDVVYMNIMEYDKKFDILLALDIPRIGRISKDYVRSNHTVMVLDHHVSNDFTVEDADYIYVEEASSTCEIVADMCRINSIELSNEALKGVYLGIYSDTIGFTTEMTDITLEIVAEIRRQVQKTELDDLISSMTKNFDNMDMLNFAAFISYAYKTNENFVVIGKSYMHMSKVIRLASMMKQETIVIADNTEKDYFHVEVLSAKPIALEIINLLKKKFGGHGGGHHHRAGGGVHAKEDDLIAWGKKIISNY